MAYKEQDPRDDGLDDPDEEDDEAEQGLSCCGLLKMIVHFVASQSLPIIMFYVGLRSYLETLVNWEATHMIIKVPFELGARNITLGDATYQNVNDLGSFLDCIRSESLSLMKSFTSTNSTCIGSPGMATAWGLDVPLPAFITGINFGALFLVVVFILILLVELCAFSGATGIGQGRYIAFSFTVQGSIAYKVMSGIIVVFCLLVLMDTIRFLHRLVVLGNFGFMMNFAEYLLLTVLTVVYSAIKLMQSATIEPPFFDYTTEEFKDLQFNRGWPDVAVNNDTYSKQLGVALLRAKFGDTKSLKAMCSSPLSDVEFALAPVTD